MKKRPLFQPQAVSYVSNLLKVSKSSILPVLFNIKKYYNIKRQTDDSGKVRVFYRPHDDLLRIQKSINKHILNKAAVSEQMHGYRKKRSCLTNAQRHIGKKIVAKYDIKNFFPSIHYRKVFKVFEKMNFSKREAYVLTRLTTAGYCLPHGFATSPMLANLVLNNLSIRMNNALKKWGLVSTFYSDDVTISGSTDIKRFEKLIIKIFKQEGFVVNPEKIYYLGRRQRQEITGWVVNEKLNLKRRDREAITAIIHNCKNKGPSSQIDNYWEKFGASKKGKKTVGKFKERLRGKINIFMKLNPIQYEELKNDFEAINWSN